MLPKRFERFGLTLHSDKTRLARFGPPRSPDDPGPKSFDFLGFTHYWGKSRKGNWVVKRKTAGSRFTRSLKRIAEYCRRNRHEPFAKQHAALERKLQGHYGYNGITGNSLSLGRFRNEVGRSLPQTFRTEETETSRVLFDCSAHGVDRKEGDGIRSPLLGRTVRPMRLEVCCFLVK